LPPVQTFRESVLGRGPRALRTVAERILASPNASGTLLQDAVKCCR
jgi:hypothetical protein